jgi:ABC-type antimicrobial peptide transport system permease subunit
MSLVVRVAGDPAGVSAAVRQAVARVDPDVPAADLRMLTSLLDETVVRPRAASLIGLAFAILALLVAAAGIYGVLTYAVQSRTREIGIRAALGASGRQLVGMVMGHYTRLVLLGLVLGCGGALAAGRFLASLLFGVPVWDPVSLLGACAILGSVGTLAAWLPARRATRADPRDALRSE